MLRSDDESVGLLSENWGWGWGLEQTRGESPRWDTRGGVLKAKGSDDGAPLPSPPSPLLPMSWLPPSPLPPPPLLSLPQCFERGPAPGPHSRAGFVTKILHFTFYTEFYVN